MKNLKILRSILNRITVIIVVNLYYILYYKFYADIRGIDWAYGDSPYNDVSSCHSMLVSKMGLPLYITGSISCSSFRLITPTSLLMYCEYVIHRIALVLGLSWTNERVPSFGEMSISATLHWYKISQSLPMVILFHILLTLLLIGILYFLPIMLYRTLNNYWNRAWFSNFLRRTILKKKKDYNKIMTDVSSIFSSWRTPRFDSDRTNNPHKQDANIRSSATSLIHALITKLNNIQGIANTSTSAYTRYDVQTTSDKISGCNEIFGPIDLKVDPKSNLPNNPVFTFIDVDYYLDMKYWMSLFQPIMMYTFCPQLGTHHADTSDHSISNDQVKWEVVNGFQATHKVWNYGTDYVSTYYFNSITDFGYVVYKRMSYHFEKGRAVIVLIPMARLTFISTILAPILNRGDNFNLRRYKYNHQGELVNWTAMCLWGEEGKMISIANSGVISSCITLHVNDFSKLVNMAMLAKNNKLESYKVVTATKDMSQGWLSVFISDYINYKFQIDLVAHGFGYYESGKQITISPACCDAHDSAPENLSKDYRVEGHSNKTDGKPTVMQVGKPVVTVNAAKGPVKDDLSAKKSVNLRIDRPLKEAESTVDTSFVEQHIQLFIDHLKSDLHMESGATIEPLTDDEVRLQIRPVYVPQFLETKDDDLRTLIDMGLVVNKSFMKAEAAVDAFGGDVESCDSGGDSKAPRIISPPFPPTQSKLYRYSLALQDLIHNCDWFAFGKPPSQLSEHIAKLTSQNTKVLIESDYSKYDGTITKSIRELEKKIYMSFFPKQYHDEITNILNSMLYSHSNLLGVGYDPKTSRLSGAADTCLMNSLCNLFAMFCALETFEGIIVGGDDGIVLTSKNNVDKVKISIKKCGFKAKVEVKQYGEVFTFLARKFMWGSAISCGDPHRILPKLHLISGIMPQVQANVNMYEKLISLYLSDHSTPMLNNIILFKLKETVKILSDHPEIKDNRKFTSLIRVAINTHRWQSQAHQGGGWLNCDKDWMIHIVSHEVTNYGMDNLVSQIDKSTGELQRIASQIDNIFGEYYSGKPVDQEFLVDAMGGLMSIQLMK